MIVGVEPPWSLLARGTPGAGAMTMGAASSARARRPWSDGRGPSRNRRRASRPRRSSDRFRDRAEHHAGVEHLVVEGEIVARDHFDPGRLLAVPGRGAQRPAVSSRAAWSILPANRLRWRSSAHGAGRCGETQIGGGNSHHGPPGLPDEWTRMSAQGTTGREPGQADARRFGAWRDPVPEEPLSEERYRVGGRSPGSRVVTSVPAPSRCSGEAPVARLWDHRSPLTVAGAAPDSTPADVTGFPS